jgi:phosphomannomutase
MFNLEIFKAYDIRGIYPDDFEEDFAYRLGRAFADFVREKQRDLTKPLEIVINKDDRASSEPLYRSLRRGLLDAGCYVISAGFSTSPMHYYIVNKTAADGGIMVTASHNPSKYNGFKLSLHEAMPVGRGTGMDEIKNLIFKKNYADKPATIGTVIEKDFLADYVDFLTKGVVVGKIKIVVDAGNGMAGMVMDEVAKKYPELELIPLYFERDFSFPNHEANPLKEETLEDLKKLVIEKKADIGVAFDGDGDRVFFVTHEGKVVKSEHVAAFYAQELLRAHPGAKIVVDPRESKILSDVVKSSGGEVVISRVGHAFFKRILKEGGAVFGAEMVGHFYFRDFFGVDSGMFMMMRLLELLTERRKTLQELISPFEGKYFHSGEINFETEKKDEKVRLVEETFKHLPISRIDGLTIEDKDWWLNVRASNTEPYLRLNIEANSKELLREKVRQLVDLLSD